MSTHAIGRVLPTETLPIDRATEAEAAFRIGRRFGDELRANYGPKVAGLPAAETLLDGADPDLLPVGHAFLDGVRLALAADRAEGRCAP